MSFTRALELVLVHTAIQVLPELQIFIQILVRFYNQDVHEEFINNLVLKINAHTFEHLNIGLKVLHQLRMKHSCLLGAALVAILDKICAKKTVSFKWD
jgi:hypothetical protein